MALSFAIALSILDFEAKICPNHHIARSGMPTARELPGLQESKLRSEAADLRLQLEDMTRQAEENKEHDAALDDLLKQKQELIQERDNQAGLGHDVFHARHHGLKQLITIVKLGFIGLHTVYLISPLMTRPTNS